MILDVGMKQHPAAAPRYGAGASNNDIQHTTGSCDVRQHSTDTKRADGAGRGGGTMNDIQALAPGEHVDLDSGMMVERMKKGDQFRIDHPDLGYVVLNRDEIETVAALAGVR